MVCIGPLEMLVYVHRKKKKNRFSYKPTGGKSIPTNWIDECVEEKSLYGFSSLECPCIRLTIADNNRLKSESLTSKKIFKLVTKNSPLQV